MAEDRNRESRNQKMEQKSEATCPLIRHLTRSALVAMAFVSMVAGTACTRGAEDERAAAPASTSANAPAAPSTTTGPDGTAGAASSENNPAAAASPSAQFGSGGSATGDTSSGATGAPGTTGTGM